MSGPKKMPMNPLSTVTPARVSAFQKEVDRRPEAVNSSEALEALKKAQAAPPPEVDTAAEEAEEETPPHVPEKLGKSVLEDAVEIASISDHIRWEAEQETKRFEAQRRLVERMERVEERLDPIDVEEALLTGIVRQEVPVSPRITYVFQTIPSRVDIVAARVAKEMYEELSDDDDGMGRVYLQQVATICCGVLRINGRVPGPRSVDELSEAGRDVDLLREIITDLMNHRLDLAPPINQELYAHYSAFIARVRRAFADDVYVDQSVGNS